MKRLDLSIVVPAFDEESNLGTTIESLRQSLDSARCEFEIIIVNDGSRDGTATLADALAAHHPAITALHQANQGIGGAFRTGMEYARGEYVVLWPADMPAEISDVMPYVGKLGVADVIVGVRESRIGYNPLMSVNAWIYPRLVWLLFGLRLPDVNWIHAYRTAKLRQIRLEQRGIPMLVEALVRLRDAGATFATVPVRMKARTAGTPSAARPRVMWRTLAGLLAFWRRWRSSRSSP